MQDVGKIFPELVACLLRVAVSDKILLSRFVELGGDSILASSLATLCVRKFGISVPISVVLKAARLQEVVAYIENRQAGPLADAPLEQGALLAEGPLLQSGSQKMVYFAHAIDPLTTAYNIPLILDLPGAVSTARFAQALNQAAEHFPMLYCRFFHGEGVQYYAWGRPSDIPVAVFASLEQASRDFVQPFDLAQPPLIRAAIVPFDGARTRLLLDISHIAADGMSVGLLVRTIRDYLLDAGAAIGRPAALCLPAVPAASSRWRSEDEAFWRETLRQVEVTPLWPADRPASHQAAPLGYAVARTSFDPALATEIKGVAQRYNTTPFTAMLLAFVLLQVSFSQKWDSHVGIVVNGRTDPETGDAFGMFVNTLILPFLLNGEMSVPAALDALALRFLSALDHQSYPLQSQMHHVKNGKSVTARPLLDALFVYQNIDYQKTDILGGRFRSFCEAKKMAQLPQVVQLFDLDEQGYDIQWEYCPKIYDAATIAIFGDHLKKIVRNLVCADATTQIAALMEWRTLEDTAAEIVAADFDF